MTTATDTAAVYSVNLWGSHPDEDNDDCWIGHDFSTLEEAMVVYENPAPLWTYMGDRPSGVAYCVHVPTEGEYVEITGPDIYEVRQLVKGEWTRSRRQARRDDDDDDAIAASESKWEHRMLHGCDY